MNNTANLPMATIVLIILLAAEGAIAAAHWVIPAQLMRVKRAVHITMCGAFWLIVLAGVIPWSFRCYGLAALLSAWALHEGWLLYRKRETPPAASPTRVVLQAGAAMLLVILAITPALIFPPYTLPGQTGQYAVATATRSRHFL